MSEKTEAMTPERIAEIKAREGKATPGPWVVDCNGISSKNGTQILNAGSCIPDPQTAVDYGGTVHDWKEEIYDYGVHKWDDAAFIAHARQDIPDLLAEVEWLRAENKRLERQVMQLAEAEQMRAREALIEAQLAKGWITSIQGGRHE